MGAEKSNSVSFCLQFDDWVLLKKCRRLTKKWFSTEEKVTWIKIFNARLVLNRPWKFVRALARTKWWWRISGDKLYSAKPQLPPPKDGLSVWLASYFHMWKDHRCYGYIINLLFRSKKYLSKMIWHFIGVYIIYFMLFYSSPSARIMWCKYASIS